MLKIFVQPVLECIPDVRVAVRQILIVKLHLYLSGVFQCHITVDLNPKALPFLKLVTVFQSDN
ncbi:hypothetical protein D3C77_413460 [compost metagenome]